MSKSNSRKKSGKKAGARKPKQTAGVPIRLSQCMIVKNEEKNIERALSWGKEIVCEQIVVDTGSTDRTVEIAERMGARVVHFEWIDDFSAAKNFAIEQASGDWIALLDADEYFEKEDAIKLMQLLKKAHGDRRIDIIRTRWVHLKDDGNILGISCQDRVFRNDPKIRYRFRIHEDLSGVNGAKLACFDVQNEISIMHTGYGAEVDMPEKGLRNARMLLKDLEDDPANGQRLMYLADAYHIADREGEALEAYRRVLWDPEVDKTDTLAMARAGFQIMDIRRNEPLDETEEEYRRIADKIYEIGWGNHPDADYYMGFRQLRAVRLTEAAELFESALEKLNDYRGGEDVRMLSNIQIPYWVTAASALSEGNLQKAVSRAVDCLRVDKYNGDGIHVLIKAFQFEYQSSNSGSVVPYRDFLFKLYDAGNLKDILFLHKFAKEAGFRVLDELICEALPPEVRGQV